ncbi:hypothetical protein LFL96_25885 [Paraburkholderia sp. D15]|uniref:hypothetical protein n=1 Tax=Paraburkholderia sp. D15 TaxID=2880218 RepID=UPI00247866BF|nr:hypothetical protein [Paraburkholderia sp. D15]WGS54447.1 hypothetical protein LFL96_25885 [Paraburkholderia sp. D15]
MYNAKLSLKKQIVLSTKEMTQIYLLELMTDNEISEAMALETEDNPSRVLAVPSSFATTVDIIKRIRGEQNLFLYRKADYWRESKKLELKLEIMESDGTVIAAGILSENNLIDLHVMADALKDYEALKTHAYLQSTLHRNTQTTRRPKI